MSDDIIQTLRTKIVSQPTSRDKNTKTQEEITDDIHRLKVQTSRQIRWLRWGLFFVIVVIACVHLFIRYYFLDKAGNANIKLHGYFLSDEVLMIFLGTTTADVFGLLFILTRYLFPSQSR